MTEQNNTTARPLVREHHVSIGSGGCCGPERPAPTLDQAAAVIAAELRALAEEADVASFDVRIGINGIGAAVVNMRGAELPWIRSASEALLMAREHIANTRAAKARAWADDFLAGLSPDELAALEAAMADRGGAE